MDAYTDVFLVLTCSSSINGSWMSSPTDSSFLLSGLKDTFCGHGEEEPEREVGERGREGDGEREGEREGWRGT